MNEILQSVPFAVVLLVIGFVFLVKGADAFVEGCSSVAKRFHVPTLIIGMTIVAMGTSLPETAVSITASISGNNALAVSNAVGSNIFNLMVVVGVCAVLTPLAVQVGILKRDFPLSIACAILLLILGAIDMTLGHVDGVVFIVLFAFFWLRRRKCPSCPYRRASSTSWQAAWRLPLEATGSWMERRQWPLRWASARR